MNAENAEGGTMRPVRRTEKLVVREVGDELVAYALDTEQVTALDPVAAQVWQRLDGRADLDDIAQGSGLQVDEVEQTVARLDDAGLIAAGVDRRRFIRFAAAGAGAGALLTIAAPAAMAAGSNRKLTVSAVPTCTVQSGTYSAIINITFSGTGYPTSGTAIINYTITFGGTGAVPPDYTSSVSVPLSSSSFTVVVQPTLTNTKRAYNNRAFTVSAVDSLQNVSSGTASVSASAGSAGSLAGSCPAT